MYRQAINISHTSSPNLESHPSRMSIESLKHLREAIEADKSLSTSQGRRDILVLKEK